MTAPIYMDAQIPPNRSLSDRGMKVVLGIVIAFNALVALFLLVLHAPVVLPFLGLDVLGIWLALGMNSVTWSFKIASVTLVTKSKRTAMFSKIFWGGEQV